MPGPSAEPLTAGDLLTLEELSREAKGAGRGLPRDHRARDVGGELTSHSFS